MNLAFCIQASDMPRSDLNPDHPAQPQLLHFAGIAFDEEGTELDQLVMPVRPQAPVVPLASTFQNHEISLEQAFHQGVEPMEILHWFVETAARARTIVGHDLQTAIKVMSLVCSREAGLPWKPPCETYSTLENYTQLMKSCATGTSKRADIEAVRLPTPSECVGRLLGGRDRRGTDAIAEVRNCIRLYQRLTSLELVA